MCGIRLICVRTAVVVYISRVLLTRVPINTRGVQCSFHFPIDKVASTGNRNYPNKQASLAVGLADAIPPQVEPEKSLSKSVVE